ncbi:hypothetical protein ACTPEM_25595, partial [Clostridioides difficile]
CHNTMQGMPVVMPSTMPPNIYPTPYGSSNMSVQGIPQATNIEGQANTLTATDILKSYQLNRFTIPSGIDPEEIHALESKLLRKA